MSLRRPGLVKSRAWLSQCFPASTAVMETGEWGRWRCQLLCTGVQTPRGSEKGVNRNPRVLQNQLLTHLHSVWHHCHSPAVTGTSRGLKRSCLAHNSLASLVDSEEFLLWGFRVGYGRDSSAKREEVGGQVAGGLPKALLSLFQYPLFLYRAPQCPPALWWYTEEHHMCSKSKRLQSNCCFRIRIGFMDKKWRYKQKT